MSLWLKFLHFNRGICGTSPDYCYLEAARGVSGQIFLPETTKGINLLVTYC